jgi:hypothetical protein
LKEKKRKFYGNRHVKVEELPDSEASEEKKIAETRTSNLTTASDEVTSSSASEFRSLPASKRKLDCDLSSMDEENCTDGFRIIDISILMSIFNTIICPKCKSGHIFVMKEDCKDGTCDTTFAGMFCQNVFIFYEFLYMKSGE